MQTIHIQSDKAKKSGSAPAQLIMSLFLLLSFTLLFFPFLSRRGFALSCASALVFFAFLTLFDRFKASRTFFCVLLVFSAVALFSSFSRGLLAFLNDIISLINRNFASQLSAFVSDGGASKTVFFAFFFCAAALLLSSLISWERTYVFGIVIFVVFEFFAVLRVRQSIFIIAAVSAALIICRMLSGIADGTLSFASLFLSGALVGALCLVFCFAFSGFSGSDAVGRINSAVSEGVSRLRYGSDSLPEGDMRLAYAMNNGKGTVMKVKTSAPSEEYMTGFVGASFSDGVWKPHGTETFSGSWSGVFRWLASKGFYPVLHYSKCSEGAFPEQSVTVENLKADRRYIYLPHTVKSIDEGSFKMKDDLFVASDSFFGTRSYSFTEYVTIGTEDDILKERSHTFGEEYSDAQAVYSGFVNEVYTKLDDETAAFLNDVFFSTDLLDGDSGIYSIITRIRAVLELRTSYAPQPLKYTSDADFSDWFLNTARSGNSAYYATIGVLCLRAAGFPARYAEGYYFNSERGGELSLSARNAHAWAEVYLENAGWIPVEFTPGFYSSTLLSEQTIELSKEAAGGSSDEESPYGMEEEYTAEDTPPAQEEEISPPIGASEVLFCLAAAAALALLFLLLRCLFVNYSRRKKFGGKDAERYIYTYIFTLLSLGSVRCDAARPFECREEVARVFPGVRVEEYCRMVELMQKSVFGKTPLSVAELRSVRLFSLKLRRLLYKKSSLLSKLKLRFVNAV